MTEPRVSVVVVSQGRPNDLRKCISALRFQRDIEFEVVVVADQVGVAQVSTLIQRDAIKIREFDRQNISAARNEGLRLAAGDLVAFLDDDAVAEPTWLSRLVAPFENQKVAAAGGYVRGRNGLSLQWGAEAIGLSGDGEPIEVHETSLQVGTPYRGIKTPGTNCAFRRSTLVEIGGFDEAYAFYLDETDVNMRLAQLEASTAIVPGAEVQHGFAPSLLRGSDRAPRSLMQIGLSKGYFMKKFGSPAEKFEAFAEAQRARLTRHLIGGGLEPRDLRRLMAELRYGFDQGWARDPEPKAEIGTAREEFRPFPTFAPDDTVLRGRWIRRRRNFARAKALAAQGKTVTVFAFSPTPAFHRRWFHDDGFWVQTGGKYGKSHRDDPLFKRYRLKGRAERELKDLKTLRHTTLSRG